MRDPDLIPEIPYSGTKTKIIKLDSIPEFDIIDYDLNDNKEYNKYISQAEKDVRGSFEYQELIAFLRENMNMNKCSFYENVNNIDTYKIKIHIHHHPFTLYDLCSIVYRKRLFYNESLTSNMLAKEVTFLHYNLMVGLIPLAETVHELIHNNYLFIPMDKVYGNFSKFEELYYDFMMPEERELLDKNKKYSEAYNEDRAKNMHILNRDYIYVDLTGAYDLPKLEEVIVSMNDIIKETQNKNNEVMDTYSTSNKLKPSIIKKK